MDRLLQRCDLEDSGANRRMMREGLEGLGATSTGSAVPGAATRMTTG